LALAGSLVVNVGLCFVLLPRFGLHGVVWATAAANLFALACIYRFNGWLGQRLDRGIWIVTLLPLALGAGPWVSLMALGAIAVAILGSRQVLSRAEKDVLIGAWRQRIQRKSPAGC